MKPETRFRLTDALYLLGMAFPIVLAMLAKILFVPASDGIDITGAYIFFSIPTPIGACPVTEAQINSWAVMLSILFLCLYLTHGLRVHTQTKRQLAAEWIVEKVSNQVSANMGEPFAAFPPFIAAILALSALSSLLSLVGLFPPTSDINVVGGWAILVFCLITYYKMKCGPLYYLKSFGQPVAFLTPLNIISEVATPISMAFRHYGNVLSGSVISVLIGVFLQWLSSLVLGWLPGILGEIPFLRVGLPAVLSLYFDLFSGCLQAFIFAMLTMMYVAGAFPRAEYAARRKKK